MMFGFGDEYAMMDMTPVDNQFIREYLPIAKGDYVRVYLYGLMCCHHPEIDVSPESLSRELDIPEEEIGAAFRYWERRGLVRRISDHPPLWQYLPMRNRELNGGNSKIDPGYEIFTEMLYGIFNHERRLHGSEIAECYEWVTDLKLPPEVVVMLLKHMESIKGKNFSIHSAKQLAMQMADEDAKTLEEAEDFLSRDQEIWDGTKKILRRLGKRNAPSEDQAALYRKWTREWGFTHEAVENACAETAKGDPNMGYLDGVLRKIHARTESSGGIDEARVREDRERTGRLKQLLGTLGQGSVNDFTIGWYDRLSETYPQEMITLAARECARTGGQTGDVEKMLASWQKKGITTAAEAEDYIAEFRARSELLKELRQKWGLNGRLGEKDRAMLGTWQKELGLSREMILFTADYAAGTEKPMAYLDAILRDCAQKGIRTPEAAERAHQAHRQNTAAAPKKGTAALPAQQYSQRDYNEPGETLEELMARVNGGGTPDA